MFLSTMLSLTLCRILQQCFNSLGKPGNHFNRAFNDHSCSFNLHLTYLCNFICHLPLPPYKIFLHIHFTILLFLNLLHENYIIQKNRYKKQKIIYICYTQQYLPSGHHNIQLLMIVPLLLPFSHPLRIWLHGICLNIFHYHALHRKSNLQAANHHMQ